MKQLWDNKKICVRSGSACYTSVKNIWCLDSGATYHMCNDKTQFEDLEPVSNLKIELAVYDSTEALGKGTVVIKTINGGKTRIENVLYVPNLKNNLFSLSKCMEKGYNINSQDGKIISKGP